MRRRGVPHKNKVRRSVRPRKGSQVLGPMPLNASLLFPSFFPFFFWSVAEKQVDRFSIRPHQVIIQEVIPKSLAQVPNHTGPVALAKARSMLL